MLHGELPVGEPKWKQFASELDLAERVRFHGYLDAESLADLFSRCELGVIPMSADSFVGLPYKLCDYVKAGLGVVSSLEGECNSFLAWNFCVFAKRNNS